MERSKERSDGAIKPVWKSMLISSILSFPQVHVINMKIGSEYMLSRVAKIAG